MKSALKSMFESGFLQLMAIICLLAACALCSSGCRSVMVEDRGQKVVEINGQQTLVDQGWVVKEKSHWINGEVDGLSASINKDGSVSFNLNGAKSSPSEEFNKMMSTTFAGFASIARLAASMYSPAAASVPLTSEAAKSDDISAILKAKAELEAQTAAAKAELAKARAAASQSSQQSQTSQSCPDGNCEVK